MMPLLLRSSVFLPPIVILLFAVLPMSNIWVNALRFFGTFVVSNVCSQGISCFRMNCLLASSSGGEKTHTLDDRKRNHSLIVPQGVTLKMAFDSSDAWGVADLSETKSERFTSPASLDLVHALRRVSDCVLVGKGTVERDNCTLTVRRLPLTNSRPKQPARVILDPTLSLVNSHVKRQKLYQIFQDGFPTIVYYSSSSFSNRTDFFQFDSRSISDPSPGFSSCKMWNKDVILVDTTTHNNSSSGTNRHIDPKQVINDLALRGIEHIMIEGGPTTAMPFLKEKLVDRAILIRAPITFQSPLKSNISNLTLENAGLKMIYRRTDFFGDVVEYWNRFGCSWPCDEIAFWP